MNDIYTAQQNIRCAPVECVQCSCYHNNGMMGRYRKLCKLQACVWFGERVFMCGIKPCIAVIPYWKTAKCAPTDGHHIFVHYSSFASPTNKQRNKQLTMDQPCKTFSSNSLVCKNSVMRKLFSLPSVSVGATQQLTLLCLSQPGFDMCFCNPAN